MRYLLAAVHAFRAVYVEQVTERVKKVGVEVKEDWSKDDHAIMLPFQFVKMAALDMKSQTKDVEVGLASLSPIYTANFPKTEAEVDALKMLMTDPQHKIVTFADGKQYKGLMPDFAIEQSCADCHNRHPNSPKRTLRGTTLWGRLSCG